MPKGNFGVYDPTEIHRMGQLKNHMRDSVIGLAYYLIFFFIYLYWWVKCLKEWLLILVSRAATNDDFDHRLIIENYLITGNRLMIGNNFSFFLMLLLNLNCSKCVVITASLSPSLIETHISWHMCMRNAGIIDYFRLIDSSIMKIWIDSTQRMC